MTDANGKSMKFTESGAIKALLGVSGTLGCALIGVVLYVVLPTISAVETLNRTVERILTREELLTSLYQQRYEAAQAQERYYNQQFAALAQDRAEDGKKLTVLDVRVNVLDRRVESLEGRPIRTGKP